MSSNSSQVYFAAASDDELGGKLVEKVEKYTKNELVRQIETRVQRAWRYYYGYSGEGFHATSIINRGGDQGELAEVRVNHSRALVNALLNLVTASKFVWTPRAANIDYDSVRQCELASSVLEHYWHNKEVSRYANQAVEEAISFTEGFVHLEWDAQAGLPVAPHPDDSTKVIRTGDVKFSNVSSWDVIRDPLKKSWDELDWVIVVLWRNKFDLAARYPAKADDILSSEANGNRQQPGGPSRWESDDIPVYRFYHKACAILPFGKEVVFLANKAVLESGPLSLDCIPLHRVSPSELTGTPFGYSAYLEILGIQELSDSINTSVASNISTFGTQCIAVEDGSSTQVDEVAGGMRVIYYPAGKKPPEPLQLTKSPPEAFTYLEKLKGWQELLMGLNAVVRGEAQSDKLSGAALALLQSQALQQSSSLQGSYVRMVQNVGTTTLQAIKRKATAPLKISIVGKHKLDLVRETEVSGDSLKAVDQVYVEVGNPMSQTAAGRYQMGELLVQMKLVRSPEELQQVLDTGRLDPLTRADQEELLNILRENQDLGQGQTPVAMLHDNHLLHCKEHSAPVSSPSARRDPAVIQAFTAHMQQHYSLYYGVPLQVVQAGGDPLYRERMLLLMGQTPPPPMAPPPPPGLPPPGPPGPHGPPPPPGSNGPHGPPPSQTQGAPIHQPPPPQVQPPPAPQLPEQPQNPLTGMQWNPHDGGGAVPGR